VQFKQETASSHGGHRVLWRGFEEGELPILRAAPVGSKRKQEQRLKNAFPRIPITHFQALARYLTELTLTHKPKYAYGPKNHPGLSAIAIVQLSLHGFRSDPPEACMAELDKLQAQMTTTEESSDEILLAVFQLWSKPPQDSPVVKKWRGREGDFSHTLLVAPTEDQLPVWLQRICCDIQEPPMKWLKSSTKPSPKLYSASNSRSSSESNSMPNTGFYSEASSSSDPKSDSKPSSKSYSESSSCSDPKSDSKPSAESYSETNSGSDPKSNSKPNAKSSRLRFHDSRKSGVSDECIAWKANAETVRSWQQRHGSLPTSETALAKSLSTWLYHQRMAYKAGNLSQEKVEILEAITQWSWDSHACAWTSKYEDLKKWLAEHASNYPSKKSVDAQEQTLGAWLGRQRECYSGVRHPLLSQASVDRLLALPGWKFPEPAKVSWSTMFMHAKNWCRQNDNTLDGTVVHVRCKDQWLPLGKWVAQQAASSNQRDSFQKWYQSLELS
jgi:hypothetical protein